MQSQWRFRALRSAVALACVGMASTACEDTTGIDADLWDALVRGYVVENSPGVDLGDGTVVAIRLAGLGGVLTTATEAGGNAVAGGERRVVLSLLLKRWGGVDSLMAFPSLSAGPGEWEVVDGELTTDNEWGTFPGNWLPGTVSSGAGPFPVSVVVRLTGRVVVTLERAEIDVEITAGSFREVVELILMPVAPPGSGVPAVSAVDIWN